MIRVYGPNEKNFADNGTVISPLLCEIEEVANGIYELYLEAQLEDVDVLEEWNLIKVPTPKNDQIFRIYRPIKTLDRVEVYAEHIFYDLAGNFLEDIRPTNLTASATLDYVLQNTRFTHNFTGYSNLQTYNTAYYIRKNPVEAIIGTENSILNRWGGFLERDNYQINILQAGIDRGYEVIYGKNLLGVECDVNTNDIVTSLMPTWVKGESTKVNNTPSKYVNSPLINNYPVPRVQEFRVELTEAEQELSDNEIVTLVTERATAQFTENHIDEPKVTVDIDFVELSMTEEYKDLEFLQQIYMHDYVTVKVPHLNISVVAQVTNYTYDCLNKRYTKLRIGNVKSNLSSNNFTFHELNNKIDTATDYLTEELEKAKDLITQVEDGYVTFRKTSDNKTYEILVSDNEDITKAVNVIRLNKAGIGFSKNGYNGPFSTAITIAGGIVADFITSGTLNANLIKAGIIAPLNGNSFIDMTTGAFNFNNDIIYNPSNNKTTITNGIITSASIANATINSAQIGTLDARYFTLNGVTLENFINSKISTNGFELNSNGNFNLNGNSVAFGGNSNYLTIKDTGGRGQVDAWGTVAAKGSNYTIEMQSGGLYMSGSKITGESGYIRLSPTNSSSGVIINTSTMAVFGKTLVFNANGTVTWK